MEIILVIILFIIGLCLLISLHELGHFIAAKIFKVYCFEYSIGFGKKIVRRKSKFAETYFCIGVIPLGGYVSMYGEDEDNQDNTKNKKEEQNKEEVKKDSNKSDDINNLELKSDVVFKNNDDINLLDEGINDVNNNQTDFDKSLDDYFDVADLTKRKIYKKEQKLLKKYKNDINKVVEYYKNKTKKEYDFVKRLGIYDYLDKKVTEVEFFNNYFDINIQNIKIKALNKAKGNKEKAINNLINKYYGDYSILKKSRIDKLIRNEITIDEFLIKESEVINKVDENSMPKKRSLESISHPKKIIVMSAGIIMNFILGYVLYLISAGCFPYDMVTSRLVSNSNEVQITNNLGSKLTYLNKDLNNEYKEFLDNKAFSFLSEEDKKNNPDPFFYVLSGSSSENGKYIIAHDIKIGEDSYVLTMNNTFTSINNLTLDDQIYKTVTVNGKEIKNYNLFRYDPNTENDKFINNQEIKLLSEKTYQEELVEKKSEKNISELKLDDIDLQANFILVGAVINPNSNIGFSVLPPLKENAKPSDENIFVENPKYNRHEFVSTNISYVNKTGSNDLGLNVSFTHYQRWLKSEAFQVAGENWVSGTTAIFTSLGSLFTNPNTWGDLGGPIAILAQSATILENNPFSVYISMWGLISVNLAIINLIPIPGLDGWHIVVACYEGISRRKINSKVRKIVEYIGLGFLFLLIGVIFIKDIVMLFV